MSDTATIHAVAYARVSTPKQAVEGESLELQASHISAAVRQNGWTLFPDNHVFQEPYTGTTSDRPTYKAILKLIRANPGKVKYFVIKFIDRFSREGSMKYQQMKMELARLGVELRDISGVIQPSVNSLEYTGFAYPWSRNSPSDISELVLAETAKYERSQILTRLVGAQIKLTQDGYHVGRADDGYVVRRIFVEGKKKCALFPDPERAHFIREVFRLRADGTYSDVEIVARLNAQGFRTKTWHRWNKERTKIIGPRKGVPLTVKQMQTIIQRPAYCGFLCEKWTRRLAVPMQGGESLVSVETFNRANRGKVFIEERRDGSITILYDRQLEKVVARRHNFRNDFRFKNVVMCSTCRRALSASFSRGKSGAYFGAYHCARQHPRYAVSKATLEQAFEIFLSQLRFREDFFRRFAKVVAATFRDAQHASASLATAAKGRIAELAHEKERLEDAFLQAGTDTMRTAIERKVEQLAVRINEAGAVDRKLGVTDADIRSFVAHARSVVEHPAKILAGIRGLREQVALFGLFFADLPTYDEIVSRTPTLSLTFQLVGANGDVKSEYMNSPTLDWNTLEEEILRWKRAEWALDIVSERMRDEKGDEHAA